MKLLAALLVVAHAAAQGLPDINMTCLLAGLKIAGDKQLGVPRDTEKEAELLIAAGKDFPLDSGRFSFCQSIPGNRYFLITFNASWNNSNPPKFVPSGIQSGSSQFHPELGLCLPDVCDDHDAGVLTMMALNKVESVNQTSANPAARAIEAWAGPAGYGAGGTPHSSWAAGFNMTVWRVKSPLVDVATPDASSLAAFAFFGLILFCVVASTLVDCIMPADETIDGGMRSPLPATRRTEGGALYKPLVDPNETPPGGGGAGTREERSVSNSGGTGGSSGDKDDPTNTNSNSAAAASAASAAAEPLGLGWQQQRTGFLWGVVDMFSATRNLRKLVRLPPPAAEETGALNGIRSVSMLWIILGHTFLMPQAIAGYDNVEDILGSYGAQNGPWIQIILGAEIAVDSFFYLSGFLLAWLTLDALDKKKGRFGVKGVCMATLYRYLRLTPSLAFALMIYYKMTQFASGNGPFSWRFQHSITRRCDTTWWVELTYAMNFYPYDTDAVCMGWTWYLGNDFIFSIVGMSLVPVYWHRRKLGWFLAWAIFIGSCAATMVVCLQNDLGIYIFDKHYQHYTTDAYSRPWSRIPAYLVGVMVAMGLREWRANKAAQKKKTDGYGRQATVDASGASSPRGPNFELRDPSNVEAGLRGREGSGVGSYNHTRTEKNTGCCGGTTGFVLRVFLLVLACGTLLFVAFIPTTDFEPKPNMWSTLANALYLTFARPLWACALAVISVGCMSKMAPFIFIHDLMSHRIWVPFARLTYSAYLLHPVIIKLLAGSAHAYYHFSPQDMFYRWCGNSLLAYGASCCMYLLVERPALTLTTKLLRGAPRKKRGAARSNAADSVARRQ